MTKIKICGLSRICDIDVVNAAKVEYIGFVFSKKSKRYISFLQAEQLKRNLSSEIKAVGVFVDENPEVVASMLNNGVIDIAQLHGKEDEKYIKILKEFSNKPVIKAFKIESEKDLEEAKKSSADMILLDAGAGEGNVFDWSMLDGFDRDYFLAGGLSCENVTSAINKLHPYAVDVSSGVESNGKKDFNKILEFVLCVHDADK